MEHPANPTAARRSWPRWSSTRSGGVRREAVEAKGVLASDELRKVGRQRIDELPRSLQSFGVLSEELVAPDDEAVGEARSIASQPGRTPPSPIGFVPGNPAESILMLMYRLGFRSSRLRMSGTLRSPVRSQPACAHTTFASRLCSSKRSNAAMLA